MEDKKINTGLTNDVKSLEIIEHFARGRISLSDCYDMINERLKQKKTNYKVEDLREILDEKIEDEFKKFQDNLKEKSKEEIIEKYYETTVKSELKDEIKNMNLHDKEIAVMINQDDLLTEFYHDWLNSDVPLGESLQDTLQESVASITRYYAKQNNFRIQGR